MASKKLFVSAVEQIVKSIPRGSVLSYGAVAEQSGYPGAARAIGSMMRKNQDVSVPCHRVIRSDGRCGEYNRGGEEKKAKRLKSEGVLIKKKIVSGKVIWYIWKYDE